MTKFNDSRTTGLRIKLAVSALGLALSTSIPGVTLAQGSTQSAAGSGMTMSMPQTVADHRARAEQYGKQAAASRADAEAHRKMLADYTKTVAINPKSPGENPFITGMKQHCKGYIDAAEKQAREADEMAKLHTLRAKELEGK